jgi:hypothetical protein
MLPGSCNRNSNTSVYVVLSRVLTLALCISKSIKVPKDSADLHRNISIVPSITWLANKNTDRRCYQESNQSQDLLGQKRSALQRARPLQIVKLKSFEVGVRAWLGRCASVKRRPRQQNGTWPLTIISRTPTHCQRVVHSRLSSQVHRQRSGVVC